MSEIKVSVIIPVYNTAAYLKEAIDSVINQTLKEIEIIAVNDGSHDNSSNILQAFAANDKRVKVISFEKNRGVSVCRNTGINKAVGEYIYFFDSDDILESNCLETCYLKISEENYDFLIFDGRTFSDNHVKMHFNASYQRTQLLQKKSYYGKELISFLIQKRSYSCSVCLCFIRKDFLQYNNLYFFPNTLFEDVLFTAHMFLLAESVGIEKQTFFNRRIRENSTMTSGITETNIKYRFIIGDQLLNLKTTFQDRISIKVLNHQTRSLIIFLVKTLVRNNQIWLLVKYSRKILTILKKTIF